MIQRHFESLLEANIASVVNSACILVSFIISSFLALFVGFTTDSNWLFVLKVLVSLGFSIFNIRFRSVDAALAALSVIKQSDGRLFRLVDGQISIPSFKKVHFRIGALTRRLTVAIIPTSWRLVDSTLNNNNLILGLYFDIVVHINRQRVE